MHRPTLRTRLTAAALATVVLGCPTVLLSTAGAASGATVSPHVRYSTPPNVTYPLPTGSQSSTELDDSFRYGQATILYDACGTTVRAATPGRIALAPSPWRGAYGVRVVTSPGGLTTWYGSLSRLNVVEGQIVQAGQPIGAVGNLASAGACRLRFDVTTGTNATRLDAWTFLNRYVGQPTPTSTLFGNRGFTIATFNTLGASHTTPTGDQRYYPPYPGRTTRTIALLNAKRVDIAGLQEFQKVQYRQVKAAAGGTFGFWPATDATDTENSIIYRRSTISFVRGSTVAVPYFNGSIRRMPYAELRDNATGKTVWVINVHNPGNTYRFPNQGGWRAKAIEIERQLVVRLRATGRPVFLTGDLNDRSLAYCPFATNKLAISPDAVPSMTCLLPAKAWIDWIIAAGPVRFTTYVRDWSTKDAKISDHPMITSRAFIAG